MAVLFPWIVCYYALASVVTFFAYGWDKRRASRHGRRVSEYHLHLLELLGGWPGALFGQRHFRHKWKKSSYMFTFWCIVAVHLIAWIAWFAR